VGVTNVIQHTRPGAAYWEELIDTSHKCLRMQFPIMSFTVAQIDAYVKIGSVEPEK
jgi:hypothetical protein